MDTFSSLEPELESTSGSPARGRVLFAALLFFLVPLLGWGYYTLQPPQEFIPNTTIEIPSGYTLDDITKLLEEKSVIRSPLVFKLLIQYYGKEHAVSGGMYLFRRPLTVIEVGKRVAEGDHGITMIKVTLPEGTTREQMGEILNRDFQHITKEDFLKETEGKEGYLFPDTYFFYSVATSGPIRLTLEKNFIQKTETLKADALAKGRNWNDVITLASILEEEAATPLDRRIVAGILMERLKQGMRLQVDATFMYTLGKGSLELTHEDLNQDSPYNTYRNAGLPPTPISNPGYDAILAAIEPTPSSYLYYLSDKNGVMHYAKTFAEHKLNKKKYLE